MRLLVVAALCGIAFARVADQTQNVEIDTPGNYFWFPSPLPGETCTIKFQVKATRDAVMTFSTQKSLNNHVYQAIVGAENNKYVCIVKGRNTDPIVDRRWTGILTGEWQTFFVEFCNGQLSVKREVGGQTEDLATYTDNNPYSGNEWYVGVTSRFTKSKWKVVSSESCGITNERSPEPRDNNQPEEENREPARDDDRNENQPNRERDGNQGGSSSRRTSRGRERGTSDDNSIGRNPEGDRQRGRSNSGPSRGDRQRGSSNSGPNRGRERGTSDDNGRERNPGGDRQRGSSNSGPNRGDRQRGSSNSGPNRGRERGTSDDNGGERNPGGDRQRGSSNSGPSRGGRQRGSSNSGPNRGRERGTSDDNSGERNPGGDRQRGSSNSGPSRGGRQRGSSNSGTSRGDRQRGNSNSRNGQRSTSSNEGAPDRNNQGSNNEKFQIDISAGQTVQWKYIDEEIASPNNFRIPFWLEAGRDCYIRLASGKYQEPKEYYDIMIGFRENRFVCISRLGTTVEDEFRPNVLNKRGFTDFVLSYDGKTVQLEKGGQVLASHTDEEAIKSIKYIGILSHADGKTIGSSWLFKKNSFIFPEQKGRDNKENRSRNSKSSSKSSKKSSKKSSSSKSS